LIVESVRVVIQGGHNRKLRMRAPTLVLDDGTEVAMSGVTQIKTRFCDDGKAYCLIRTLSFETAAYLTVGTVGRVRANLVDFLTGKADPKPVDFGRFRVCGPPLAEGHHRQFAAATIRMVEEPKPPASTADDYGSFFFDDAGRPRTN
jgi:hypothetical protein